MNPGRNDLVRDSPFGTGTTDGFAAMISPPLANGSQAGCQRLFTDTAGGSHVVRPGLDEVLDFLRAGDTLVVSGD